MTDLTPGYDPNALHPRIIITNQSGGQAYTFESAQLLTTPTQDFKVEALRLHLGVDDDFGTTEIEVDLTNTGVFPLASGDAKLEPRVDRTDFSVEIEDVPVGSYGLRIGGENAGTIEVRTLQDGSVEGELEFRNPQEPGKLPLNFDPRGKQIDVLDGTTVVLETLFPSS